MKPGIHKLSNQAYHSDGGLSSSDLKELLKSPLHFRAYKATVREQTPEQIRGTLVHALILEPETIESEFAIGNFNIRRGKEYEAVANANPGKTIVSANEFSEAKKIANAFQDELKSNPELQKLMTGHKELSFYWEDKATGVLCKARPDILTPCGKIVDLKTSWNASFDAFQKQLVDYQYFLSVAYYMRGVNETGLGNLGGILPKEAYFIVIETKEPYAVAIYKLGDLAVNFGQELIDRALGTYAEAVATEKWEGYSKKPVELELPNWAMYRWNKPKE